MRGNRVMFRALSGLVIGAILLLAPAMPASAQDTAGVPVDFRCWLTGGTGPEGIEAEFCRGLDAAMQAAFGIQIDADHPTVPSWFVIDVYTTAIDGEVVAFASVMMAWPAKMGAAMSAVSTHMIRMDAEMRADPDNYAMAWAYVQRDIGQWSKVLGPFFRWLPDSGRQWFEDPAGHK